MTSITSLPREGKGIPLGDLKPLKFDLSQGRKLTAEEITHFQEQKAELQSKIQRGRELMLAPEYTTVKQGAPDELYAVVNVPGGSIKIFNSGVMETSNAVGARMQGVLRRHDTQLSGPQGAQERAEILAREMGGTITRASTAITQAQWEALPKTELVTDWDALRRDPRMASYYQTDPANLLWAQEMATKDQAA